MEPELGARKLAVLRAVVEEFVRSGEPVGSERVAELSGLGVSSATIRNELAALEELGYLRHAHTSSGRMPTDLGYRRYVDALRGSSGRLRETQRRAIAGFFAETMVDLEHVLRGTTQLLSRLTQYAGLAVPPSDSEEAILRIEVLDVGTSMLMLLVVGQHGGLEKAIVDRPGDLDAAGLEALDRRLAGTFRGLPRSDAQALALKLAGETTGGESDVFLVVADVLARPSGDSRPQIVIGGAANLADEEARWRRETLRRLFEAFERESDLQRLLRDVTADDVSVTIGAEHPQTNAWEAALVAAPFRAGTTALGTIGVVGPTAMDYATVVASVREVARRLSELATALDS